jgi:hypothetical protein
VFGQGRLTLDYKNFRVSDGINYFIPLSFSLIRKLLRHKNRQDAVDGKWWVIGNVIWLFRKK